LEIIGAYAPAKEQEKKFLWKHLTDYARRTGTQAEQSEDSHMIIAGDWNN
jgi:exonuclease III